MKNGKKIDMGYIMNRSPSGLEIRNHGDFHDYQLPGIYPIQLKFLVLNRDA
jgi:hypothetical protein